MYGCFNSTTIRRPKINFCVKFYKVCFREQSVAQSIQRRITGWARNLILEEAVVVRLRHNTLLSLEGLGKTTKDI